MSISDTKAPATDFDRWVAGEFAETGAFTALVILVEIAEPAVVPICSTYFNVIGDEIDGHVDQMERHGALMIFQMPSTPCLNPALESAATFEREIYDGALLHLSPAI